MGSPLGPRGKTPEPGPLPSMDALRCFVAGARTLNFRAAARTVALTPAAFGHRIKQLEDELGQRLFERTTRKVSLSEAGLLLLPVAERTLGAAAECRFVVNTRGVFPATRLVVGTRHELGLSWLLPQIDELRVEHPWLELHLYFGSGDDLVHRVRSGALDAAVTSTSLRDPELAGLRLHREDYVFVAAPGLLSHLPLQGPEDALSHTLIDVDDTLPLYRYFMEADGAPELRFAGRSRFGTIEAIRQRVLAGAGVAVLPRYLVAPDLERGRLVRAFRRVKLLFDHFRLVVRGDDVRRVMLEALAASLRRAPLR